MRPDCHNCSKQDKGSVACMYCEDDNGGLPTKWDPHIDIGKGVVLKEMPTLYFGNPKLTIGKKYKVVDVEGSNFWIIDDEGKKCTFGSCRFDEQV